MTISAFDIIFLVLMLVLSGFFSGIEIAFVSANRLKIELKKAQGEKAGLILSDFVKKTPRVITTILVGNNLALVIYGITIARILNYFLWSAFSIDPNQQVYLSLVLQTLISTLIILFLGEYLPKAFFRLYNERILFNIRTLRFLQFFYYIFYWPVISINALSRFVIKRVLRQHYEEEELTFGKQDLHLYMQETLSLDGEGGQVPEIDAEMFTNAMAFNEIRAREFMIPRTEIEAMPSDCSVEELRDKFIETGKSKIVIYGESLDEVLGYVHSISLFEQPEKITQVLQNLLMIPESMPGNVLLSEFNKAQKTMAIVVDEFGGTEGLVTLEDLVEEVFGEIDDEHDEPEEDELLQKKIADNTWLFSARLEVDDLNKDYDLDLPEGDYNTLSGLVMFYDEAIPEVNQTIEINNYQITVMDASENKLNTLKVVRNPAE